MSGTREELAAAFQRGGEDYDRLRPGYPPAALDWLLPSEVSVVADVGAGTGKLSRQLADAGLEVHAVDPSADMLARVADPRVQATIGTGERTGLADASVDAVVFAQSWHWVDPDLTAPELARVLRPLGRLALLWNLFDVSVPWVADYAAAMHSVSPDAHAGIEGRRNATVDLPGFTPFVWHEVAWQHVTDSAGLLALPLTRSYWLTAGADAKKAASERVRRAVARAPYTADGRVALPYVTQLARADRTK